MNFSFKYKTIALVFNKIYNIFYTNSYYSY